MLAVAAVLFTVGSLILAASTGFPFLLIGRLLLGLGVGLSSTATPVFYIMAFHPTLQQTHLPIKRFHVQDPCAP